MRCEVTRTIQRHTRGFCCQLYWPLNKREINVTTAQKGDNFIRVINVGKEVNRGQGQWLVVGWGGGGRHSNLITFNNPFLPADKSL